MEPMIPTSSIKFFSMFQAWNGFLVAASSQLPGYGYWKPKISEMLVPVSMWPCSHEEAFQHLQILNRLLL